jgi:hypothetical protein
MPYILGPGFTYKRLAKAALSKLASGKFLLPKTHLFFSINDISGKRSFYPFVCYKNYRFDLHLKQWKVTNEFKSLIQILYAEKPKHPV